MEYELRGLPKVSINKFYGGIHWTKRKKIKDVFRLLLKKHKKIDFRCKCDYTFYFKSRPLDASNTMVKLIEDALFTNDKYDFVTEITIRSRKGKEDKVVLVVEEI